ncbi:5-formyltetrahydrofolate cyclo-ligase [uncultured Eubacterium sp.]|uniref:5-formyltetrahydrofolate cyclo-ligase n=1 Tax=uncultured Eubacterium sp. TaxID=165185 RepID=UPI000E966CB7|nr:5-formyltetrahydrofolate cyclo-ligase [uncultured Eubacterium sp.]HAH18257.1 5-formyltetrahydrofolate cyclo-ligase [Eubacterium sp.]HAV90784.1 5-formyltetrahydrofolate cyclo-ligase [Eubacterium sp.]
MQLNTSNILNKSVLRNEILNKRKSLSKDKIANTSELLCNKIINHPKYKDANIILAYMAQDGEIDLEGLMKDAISKDKKVYIPKVLRKHTMEFYRYTNKDDLEISNFGILEPKEKEPLQISETDQIFVIVPGVAFDKSGNRIGYGGGFYDTYLSNLLDKYNNKSTKTKITDKTTSSIYTLAPCYNFQLIDFIKSEDFDIPVMEVITL